MVGVVAALGALVGSLVGAIPAIVQLRVWVKPLRWGSDTRESWEGRGE